MARDSKRAGGVFVIGINESTTNFEYEFDAVYIVLPITMFTVAVVSATPTWRPALPPPARIVRAAGIFSGVISQTGAGGLGTSWSMLKSLDWRLLFVPASPQ